MIKSDFHLHSREDPKDPLRHSAKQLISYLSHKKYTAMALTLHDRCYFNQDLKNYAKRKNITLIPGAEATVEGKHVLLLDNPNQKLPRTFDELEKNKDNFFMIPAHPFHPGSTCIGKNLFLKYKNLWDAVEYSRFHTHFINPNNNTLKLARKLKIPLVGNSDAHRLQEVGDTYSLINSSEKKDNILESIRKNNVKVRTRPLPLQKFLGTAAAHALRNISKKNI